MVLRPKGLVRAAAAAPPAAAAAAAVTADVASSFDNVQQQASVRGTYVSINCSIDRSVNRWID
jgi:hypothetical protein